MERFTTQLEMMQSTELSATGRYSISPSRKDVLGGRPCFTASLALAREVVIISWVMSTPITRPSAPTIFEARKQSKPAPEPRSSTVSPSTMLASARGCRTRARDCRGP